MLHNWPNTMDSGASTCLGGVATYLNIIHTNNIMLLLLGASFITTLFAMNKFEQPVLPVA